MLLAIRAPYTFSGEADWTSLAEAAEDVKESNKLTGEKKIVFKAQHDKEIYFIKYINADKDYISVNFLNSENNFYSQELPYGDNSPQVYPPSTKYYTFDHWEYGKNANNPYTTQNFQIDGEDVTWDKLSTKVESGKVILVKAIYNPIKYAIKYKDGESDAVVAAGTQADYTADENTLDSAIPDNFKNGIKTGYRFNRWMYVNVLGRWRKMIPGRTKWRNLVDGATANNEIILRADYEPITYTIKYVTKGGDNFEDETYTTNEEGKPLDAVVNLNKKPRKYNGKKFKEWRYGKRGECRFNSRQTTWENLVKTAVVENGGNVIYFTASYYG